MRDQIKLGKKISQKNIINKYKSEYCGLICIEIFMYKKEFFSTQNVSKGLSEKGKEGFSILLGSKKML